MDEGRWRARIPWTPKTRCYRIVAGAKVMRREVFGFNEPCDMRKSFDGLYGLIRDMNPLAGFIFLFVSKDRKRAKSLHWDGTEHD